MSQHMFVSSLLMVMVMGYFYPCICYERPGLEGEDLLAIASSSKDFGFYERKSELGLADVKQPRLKEDEPTKKEKKRKPNIFLVLVDDLGWGNLGYRAGETMDHGGTSPNEAITPTIDSLMRSGVVLNRHYTYNYCSPTRASLQSGRLPVHVSMDNDEPTVYNPKDPISGFAGIPRKMTGVAEKMKSVGYKTHMTGKWDAGMATWDHTPMGRGYDSFFGYYYHANDYYTEKIGTTSVGPVKNICQKNGYDNVDLWDTNTPAYGKNGTAYEEELFTKNTLKIINDHDTSKPLFLFHSFHIVHTPLQVPREHEQRFEYLLDKDRRLYAAMVNYMDESMSKFISAFQRKGMYENTLVIVSSDNGGPIYGKGLVGSSLGAANNIPLRGGKLSDWEGGIRVNAFISGGFVPVHQRGTILNEYIHIADWYATLCDIAGVDPFDKKAEEAKLPPIDSMNMWPLLSGSVTKSPREEIHVSEHTLIVGEYKVLTGGGLPQASIQNITSNIVLFDGYWPGWGNQATVKTFTKWKNCKTGCLYNIIEDPFEKEDLAKSEPILLEKMLTRLTELNKSIFRPKRGSQSIKACTKWQGYYGPFIE